MFWDIGDYCLRQSLYTAAKIMLGELTEQDVYDFKAMESECRTNTFFRQRKSTTYKWSNSGSANESENTLWSRPTYWISKHLGIDMYKGLNFDQLRALWLVYFLAGKRLKAVKHLIGFVLRLGFAPSWTEHALFKPQAFICLLATIWKPLAYLVMPFFAMSVHRENKIPVSVSTTNKITLIPTLLALGLDTSLDIKEVYNTYFTDLELRTVLKRLEEVC